MANDAPRKGEGARTAPVGKKPIYLPGKAPSFRSQSELVKWLRKNPGWVYKNRGWVKSQIGREAGLAGYVFGGKGSKVMTVLQYEGGSNNARGKLIRAWTVKGDPSTKNLAKTGLAKGAKVIEVDPPGNPYRKPKPNAKPPVTTSGRPPSQLGPKPSPSGGKGKMTPSGGRGGSRGTAGSKGSVISGMAGPEFQFIPEYLARQGAQPMSEDFAEALAALQFDSEIRELERMRELHGRQSEQNLKDIGDWYGQVSGHLASATQRDKEITQAGVQSMEDASKAILSSLGGAANPAAASVGSTGAAAVGTLQALGAAQDQYNTDLAPLLQSEAAGAKTRQMNLDSQRASEMASQLLGLRGERGNAKASALFDIRKINADLKNQQLDRLMRIREANNQMRQQDFANRLSLTEADMAAQELGIRKLGALADLARANKGKQPRLPTPTEFSTAANDAYSFVKDESGQWFPDFLTGNKLNVPKVVNAVNNSFRQRGWSVRDPQVARIAMTVLQDLGIRPDPRWYGLGARKK